MRILLRPDLVAGEISSSCARLVDEPVAGSPAAAIAASRPGSLCLDVGLSGGLSR